MSMRAYAAGLVGLACAAAVGVSGCSSPPPPPPPPRATTLTAVLDTAADVNPDAAKRASPLMVRVYELSSRALFESADFVSLFDRDTQALAGEIVAREEWVMAPGESRNWTKKLPPETRFIGVTAAYRDIERARWRAIVVVQPQAANTLTIRAEALTLSASASAR